MIAMKWMLPLLMSITLLLANPVAGKDKGPFKIQSYDYLGFIIHTMHAFQHTPDGGSLISFTYVWDNSILCEGKYGNTKSALVKLNASGKVEWKMCYPTRSTHFSVIRPDGKGNYFITGHTNQDLVSKAPLSNLKIFLTRITAGGDVLWTQYYGDPGVQEKIHHLEATQDGGCLMVGEYPRILHQKNDFNVDFYALKVNAKGEKQWIKTFDKSRWDKFNVVRQKADGNYILGGSGIGKETDKVAPGTAWIMELNQQGELVWEKNFGGGKYDYIAELMITKDGYIFLGRESGQNNNRGTHCGREGFWIYSIGKKGESRWSRYYHHRSPAARTYGINRTLLPTYDGGFILGGVDLSDIKDGNIWMARFTKDGELVGDKVMELKGCQGVLYFQKTNDGYVAAGFGDNHKTSIGSVDNWIMHFTLKDDQDLPELATKTHDSDSSEYDVLMEIGEEQASKPKSNQKGKDEELAGDETEEPFVFDQPMFVSFEDQRETHFNIFPNPARDHVTLQLDETQPEVSISIFTDRGKQVYSNSWKNTREIQLSLQGFASGIYFVRLAYRDKQSVVKLVIL